MNKNGLDEGYFKTKELLHLALAVNSRWFVSAIAQKLKQSEAFVKLLDEETSMLINACLLMTQLQFMELRRCGIVMDASVTSVEDAERLSQRLTTQQVGQLSDLIGAVSSLAMAILKQLKQTAQVQALCEENERFIDFFFLAGCLYKEFFSVGRSFATTPPWVVLELVSHYAEQLDKELESL